MRNEQHEPERRGAQAEATASDTVTVSGVKSWVPFAAAVITFLGGGFGTYYSLRAEDAKQVSATDVIRTDLEQHKRRIDVLEQGQTETKGKLDNLDRKLDRVICALYPKDDRCRP